MTTAIAFSRQLTTEDSSAISFVSVNGNDVVISYHTNPNMKYSYTATDSVVSDLERVVSSQPVKGLGSLVSQARSRGDLVEVKS